MCAIFIMQYSIQMLSFFQCCKSDLKRDVYQIRTKEHEGTEEIYYVEEVDKKLLEGIMSAVRVRVSQFEELKTIYKNDKLFTDPTFPPSMKSIGNFPDLPHDTHWKRISQIVKDAEMFIDGIEPSDIIQKKMNRCYFLSTVATLAEKEQRIERIFLGEKFNKNGLYRVKLRVNGFIKEIIVDDFVPVDEDGQPLFCQPNESEIWVMILEKAWAKLKGSYENICEGNPTEVFKAVTYSPGELFAITKSCHRGDKLWEDLVEFLQKRKPVCAGTRSLKDSDGTDAGNGLVLGHFYTVIDAVALKDTNNQLHRIMRLRNPWGRVKWEGEYAQDGFWDKITNCPAKRKIIESEQIKGQRQEDGVFFMGFQDFCHNFESLHICHMADHPFYEIKRVYFNGKNGQVYLLTVIEEGEYIIELHQSQEKYDPKSVQKIHSEHQETNRATIIVMKPGNYEFIDGAFTYNENDTTLRLQLCPGKHLVYIKMDKDSEGHLPWKTALSCYSESLVVMKKLDKKKLGNFYPLMFSEYANHNKRKTFNEEKMWMTWKQFYQKGGLAFVAFGNDIISDKKFMVSFSEKDFDNVNYVLKKPYKGQGEVHLEILPGEEKIIVSRVKKGPSQQMKFPPDIKVKIQPI